MSAIAAFVEYLAQRPDLMVALCLVAVVALVLAERFICPAEVTES